jgi:acetoin:2,6-dichlorophenolindophenol oxidoreductase subunit alpha
MHSWTPDQPMLIDMYAKMALIKHSDERIISALKSGKMRMPYYSARGQECIPAAVSVLLNDQDYLITIYRGVHDMLAKGLPAKLLWAELAGRATGTCKGKGGPMHLTYPQKGCMVTTGIVGASLPIAAGCALAAQIRGDGRVAVANFGDGAANIGAFHEAINLAAVWKLPAIFICQNNQYAEHTAYSVGTSVARIADRAAAYAIPGVRVDGNDPVAVCKVAKEALDRARGGGGPTLIEAMTFRFNGHLIGDAGEYIPPEEYALAIKNDPFPRYRSWLLHNGYATEPQLQAIEAAVRQEIDEAQAFALDSPYPDPIEVKRDVYAYEIV